ncbi:MAG: hypothetical protein V3V30_01330 [Parvularculaceae bacterium]
MIALPALAIASLLVFIISIIPAKYESAGKLMVRTQQISPVFIKDKDDMRPVERFQLVQQFVMARANLLEVSTKHTLFGDEKISNSEKIDTMRKNIIVKIDRDQNVSARSDDIAFLIGYRHADPGKAYVVANELVTLFLNKSSEISMVIAEETVDFLRTEKNRLERELVKSEADIANTKATNSTSLPEHLEMHMGALQRASSEMNRIDSEVAASQQEMRYLVQQGGGNAGGLGYTDEGKLSELRQRREELLAQYTDLHPEVRVVNEQIAALQVRLNPTNYLRKLNADLRRVNGLLAKAKRNGSDSNTIIALEGERGSLLQQQNEAKRMIAQNRANSSITSGSAAISSLQSRLDSLTTQRQNMLDTINEYESRINKTASVELELTSKIRLRDNLQEAFDSVQTRLDEASLAESMVRGDKGATLELLDQPVEPERPTSPDRIRLSFLGLVFSGMLALALALVPELLMPKIRSKSQLQEFVPIENIVAVPQYHKKETRLTRNSMLALKVAAMVGLGVVLVGLLIFTIVR